MTASSEVREAAPRSTIELRDGSCGEYSAPPSTSTFTASEISPWFSWIGLPVFTPDGLPVHDRGVVAAEPGPYFLGLEFQYAATSGLITGMTRDTAYVMKHGTRRVDEGSQPVTKDGEPVSDQDVTFATAKKPGARDA